MKLKKWFVAFLCAALILTGTLPASRADSYTRTLNGRYSQTEARSMLDMINQFRTGDTWYWNSDDTTKTTIAAGTLSPLTYDYAIERIAMQRAAEHAAYPLGTRPDGTLPDFTSYKEIIITGKTASCGVNNAKDVFTSLQAEGSDFDGQFHRREMLEAKYAAVGISCFVYKGTKYWVLELGRVNSGMAATSANDSETAVDMKVSSEYHDHMPIIQPQSVTARPGQAVTFSVKATEADSYQWLYKMSGDSEDEYQYAYGNGAQTDVYTVTATQEMNGCTFVCRVRDASIYRWYIYSDEAVLTVSGEPIVTPTPTPVPVSAIDPATIITGPLSFNTTTLDGKAYSSDVIKDYDLVVVNIWDERCDPCVWELPYLQQLSQNYKNVLMLGVWDGYNEEEAIQIAKEAGVTFPLLRPTGMLLDLSNASEHFPHTFFFKGNSLQVGDMEVGATDYSGWESIIKKRLAMPPFDSTTPSASTVTPTPTPTPTPVPQESAAVVKKVQAKKSVKLQAPKTKGNAYQWYVRTSKNAPWQSMGKKGAKDKLSVKATMAMDGYQYRCQITSASGVKYTDIYELYVYEQLKVKKQPKWGKASTPGSKMTLSITATGASGYQWMTRPNGSAGWTVIDGATGTSYVVDVQEGMAGRQYACQISGKAGTAQSKAAVVKIAPWPKVKFSKQPVLKKPVVPGSWVTLTVKAANADTYQWYYRTSAKGAWILYSGATQPNLTFQVQAGTNGYQYKCTAKGRGGTVDSKPVTLKVVTP